MPGRDKTGPNQMGPRTGRGLGNCNEFSQNQGFGRGRGFGNNRNSGYGRGRGFRMRQGYANEYDDNRNGFLKNLENRLSALEEKIDSIFRNK